MNLFTPFTVVILTQFFWLALLILGYLTILTAYGITNKPLPRVWREAPIFARVALAFAAIGLVYSIWTIIGYAFKLPAWWLGVSSILTTSFLLVYAAIFLRQKIKKDVLGLISSLKDIRLFSLSTAVLLIVFADYLINVRYGAYLSGDALVHMAKIRALANDGFSLVDPAFGTAMQSSYIVTIWHTLLALPVYFGLDTVNSWFYSLAVPKLVLLSAVYYFIWTLLKAMGINARLVKPLSGFMLAIMVVLPLIMNSFLASYPNQFIVTWLSLLLIGVIGLFSATKSSGSTTLVLVSSVMIAMSHPLYSLMTGILLLFIIATFGFVGREYLTKKILVTIVLAGTILATTPLLGAIVLLGSGHSAELSSYSPEYWHLFGLKAFTPTLDKYAAAETSVWWLKALGLIGYIFILYKLRDKASKLIVVAVLLLVPLLIFNPFLFGLLHLAIPYWAMNRLYQINVLSYVSVVFGIVALFMVARHYWQSSQKLLLPLLMLVCALLALAFHPYNLANRSYRPKAGGVMLDTRTQAYLYDQLVAIQKLTDGLPKDSLIFGSVDESFMLPAVSPQQVVATPIGNTNTLIDARDRVTCTELIDKRLKTMDTEAATKLMKQVGVNYVMAPRNSYIEKGIDNAPKEFQILARNKFDSLYRFNQNNSQSAHNPKCIFNE
jgi:hypothetical protein